MKKSALLIGLYLLFGCGSEVTPPSITHNPIKFSDPQVDQLSCYSEYRATCSMGNTGYSYTGDTLIVKVIEKNSQLHFMEYFSPHSPRFLNGDVNAISYPVEVKSEYLLITDRVQSNLFFFYGNDTIWTNPEHDIELEQDGCYLYYNNDLFIGEEIGFAPELQFGNIEHSNKTVVSCVPVILALDAYLVYDNGDLNLSHTIQSMSSQQDIRGWELINN